jgi:hypothetical protein
VHSRLLNRIQQQWVISLLLVALGVRALIPVGFMPSADQPFTLQICPDGFPAQLLQSSIHEHAVHHAEGSENAPDEHGAARAEHCVFAAAATVGPAPQVALLLVPVETQPAPQLHPTLYIPEPARHRVQQPRAPPALS